MRAPSKTQSKTASRPTRARHAAKPVKPPKKAADPTPDYSIAAVGRALDLLEALARTGPAALAVVAEAAGCTAHRRLPAAADIAGAGLRDPG